MIVNLQGAFVEPDQAGISFSDGAFLYGDSLFETLKARRAHILFLDEHLGRLDASARLIDFPFDRKAAEKALRETAALIEAPCARLRLTLSRGSFQGLTFPPEESAYFLVTGAPYEEPDDKARNRGISCVLPPNQRVNPLSHLPQLKRGNYADCLYAARYARSLGAGEALFTTPNGLLLEGAVSNLFILSGGTLITPRTDHIVLPGIMRRQVLLAAERLGIPALEQDIPRDELFGADEAFLTNSLMDLMPIASVEDRSLRRGPVTARILHEIRRMEQPQGVSHEQKINP